MSNPQPKSSSLLSKRNITSLYSSQEQCHQVFRNCQTVHDMVGLPQDLCDVISSYAHPRKELVVDDWAYLRTGGLKKASLKKLVEEVLGQLKWVISRWMVVDERYTRLIIHVPLNFPLFKLTSEVSAAFLVKWLHFVGLGYMDVSDVILIPSQTDVYVDIGDGFCPTCDFSCNHTLWTTREKVLERYDELFNKAA